MQRVTEEHHLPWNLHEGRKEKPLKRKNVHNLTKEKREQMQSIGKAPSPSFRKFPVIFIFFLLTALGSLHPILWPTSKWGTSSTITLGSLTGLALLLILLVLVKLSALTFLYNSSPHYFSPKPIQKLLFRFVIVHNHLNIVTRSEEKGICICQGWAHYGHQFRWITRRRIWRGGIDVIRGGGDDWGKFISGFWR